MPGKQDPEYFPINYNMSGLGSFFGVGVGMSRAGPSPLLTPCGSYGSSHHGKFEFEPNMSFNVSIPPVNSEEDEESTDDEENETSSMTGSDIDVDMDTLVLNIRKKLKMSPKFGHHHHHHHQRHHSRRHSAQLQQSNDDFLWTDSPDSDHDDDDDHDHHTIMDPTTSDNNCIGLGAVVSSSNSMMSSNNLISNTSNNSSSNNMNSNSSNSNSGNNSNSSVRRCSRNHHSYSHSSSQWRPSNVQSISHNRHIINGRIQKNHHHTQPQWWTRPHGKKCSDSNNSASVSLLQELISSGSLINEAVRRLKQKNCFSSISANSNSSSVKLGQKFMYKDQESENNITSCYPPPQITPIV